MTERYRSTKDQIKMFTIIVHLLIFEEVGYRSLKPDGALNPQKVVIILHHKDVGALGGSQGFSGLWGLWGSLEHVPVHFI